MSLPHEESLNRPSRDTYYVLKKVKWGVRRLNLTRKVRFFSLFSWTGVQRLRGLDRTDVFWILEMPPLFKVSLLWFASPRPGLPLRRLPFKFLRVISVATQESYRLYWLP